MLELFITSFPHGQMCICVKWVMWDPIWAKVSTSYFFKPRGY